MRLSPSLDNVTVDYSPRPSVPLETVSIGELNSKPTLPPLPKNAQLGLPALQPVQVSSFFKTQAQPKPSVPTLKIPQIKVVQQPTLKAIPKAPTPKPKIPLSLPPQPHVEGLKEVGKLVVPPPPPVEVKTQPPVDIPKPVTPPPAPKPVSHPPPAEVKKVVAKEVEKVETKPTGPVPNSNKIIVPAKEIKKVVEPAKPAHELEAIENAKKAIQKAYEKPAEKPQEEVREVQEPVLAQTPMSEPIKELEEVTKKDVEKPQIEEKVKPRVEVRNVDELQDTIARELKKINEKLATLPTPKEVLKTDGIVTAPIFIKSKAVKSRPLPVPLPPQAPSQKITKIPPPVTAKSPLEVKAKPKSLPKAPSIVGKVGSFFSSIHYLDYILIRVDPKLNPYKSETRFKVIIGIKISGLILLGLAMFWLVNIFSGGFNVNVLFQSLTTFILAGIMLFLGENLSMFFAPVNPYKIREVH